MKPDARFLVFAAILLCHAAFAVPAPPQIIVNNATMQCSDFMAGDECAMCEIPPGWSSLGYGATHCPAGYTQEAAPVSCTPIRNAFCCSEGHSGGDGNCTDMVENSLTRQCAFVDARQCALPPDWQKKPLAGSWLCPAGYSWTNMTCGPGVGQAQTSGGFCATSFLIPVLGSAVLLIRR
jgi:hypothetical protein